MITGHCWPGPTIKAMSLLPGRFGEVAKLSQNVTRDELAKAIVHSLERPESIGKIFNVPELLEIVR